MSAKAIKIAANNFDSFTKEFLSKNEINSFSKLFLKRNSELLKSYLSSPEVTKFLGRSDAFVKFDENGPVYESKLEVELYKQLKLSNAIQIPYRTQENFLFSSNSVEVKSFLAKRFFEDISTHEELPDNIHIAKKGYKTFEITPYENGQCRFSETELFKNNAQKVENSGHNIHLFITTATAIKNTIVDGKEIEPEGAHYSASVLMYDKKKNAITSIIEIDTTPQGFVDKYLPSTKKHYGINKDDSRELIPIGMNIQNKDNEEDLNCPYHAYNCITSLLQTLKNKPYFINQMVEMIENKDIDTLKQKVTFEIAKTLPNIFNMKQLEEKGVIKILPAKKLNIENARDRFAASSSMIPELITKFCEQASSREL